jgi:ribosome-binding factor A
MKALKSASGYIRRALGKGILIRYAPELSFVSDQNIAYGVHIANVLQQAQKTENTADDTEENA